MNSNEILTGSNFIDLKTLNDWFLYLKHTILRKHLEKTGRDIKVFILTLMALKIFKLGAEKIGNK
jgi:hypothetical protein